MDALDKEGRPWFCTILSMVQGTLWKVGGRGEETRRRAMCNIPDKHGHSKSHQLIASEDACIGFAQDCACYQSVEDGGGTQRALFINS